MKNLFWINASLASVALLVSALLGGCGGDDASSEAEVKRPDATPAKAERLDPMALVLTDPKLTEGRDIWIPKCGQCHLTGLGGAPIIGDKEAWADRIAQGNETLYDHAINGFSGPKMLIMPPKGGFSELTDDQVKLAVDFVVFASQ
ncbi:MAG: c-type cytochrome [Verrucomicrobiota bacterium]